MGQRRRLKENQWSDSITKCTSERGHVREAERGGGVKTERLK